MFRCPECIVPSGGNYAIFFWPMSTLPPTILRDHEHAVCFNGERKESK